MPEHNHPTMRARLRINFVQHPEPYPGMEPQVTLHASPVYSDDPADPNYTYSKYSPGGALMLLITNPDLVDKFKVGQIFDVDFTLHKDA